MLTLTAPQRPEEIAYRLWLETYRKTRNPRHLATARACLDIAREASGHRPTRAQIEAYRARVSETLERLTAARCAPPAATT